MTFDVTCSHHRKKKGKNTTRTIPFRVREVHGLSGFALANADPENEEHNIMADSAYSLSFNFTTEINSTFEEQQMVFSPIL